MTRVSCQQAQVDLADVAELYALFAQVADPRQPRGVRHHIATVLTVMVFAVLAGARNFREAGDRAADLPLLLLDAAGARLHRFTGEPVAPSGSTLRRVVEDIDADAADLLVCRWIADRAQRGDGDGEQETDRRRGLAMDGKTVRRSGAGDPCGNVKLFSAMLHDQAVVIAQLRVPAATTEITQVAALLDHVDLAGAVITGDAAHTQTATAAYIRRREADYIFTLKGNQPSLLASVAAKLSAAPDPGRHLHIDRNRGQIVHRKIWITDAEGIDFPGTAQIFRIRRDVFDPCGQRLSKEIVHGVTSLADATAEEVARWVRQHWGVENKIHWVRDVVFAEDHQNAYLGAAAHGMALFRNLAIGLIRLAGHGHNQIKRTLERIAADRTRILPLLAAFPPMIIPTLPSPCGDSSVVLQPRCANQGSEITLRSPDCARPAAFDLSAISSAAPLLTLSLPQFFPCSYCSHCGSDHQDQSQNQIEDHARALPSIFFIGQVYHL